MAACLSRFVLIPVMYYFIEFELVYLDQTFLLGERNTEEIVSTLEILDVFTKLLRAAFVNLEFFY